MKFPLFFFRSTRNSGSSKAKRPKTLQYIMVASALSPSCLTGPITLIKFLTVLISLHYLYIWLNKCSLISDYNNFEISDYKGVFRIKIKKLNGSYYNFFSIKILYLEQKMNTFQKGMQVLSMFALDVQASILFVKVFKYFLVNIYLFLIMCMNNHLSIIV